MILDRLAGSGADARLLPIEKLHAPTVAFMAIMTFVMIVVAAAGLALSNAAGLVASGAENRFVIEIPAPQAAQLPRAIDAARASAGVRSAAAVPEAEMRRTLEGWLGEQAFNEDLPVPSLVTLEVEPGANLPQLRRRIEAAVPGSRLIAETTELRPLLRTIRSLQWLALSLVVLMAAAASAAVVLAARSALDTHRPTIEIMHGIGATDVQVTRLFERKIAVDAAAGALAGTIAAALVLILVTGGAAAIAGEFAAAAPLRALDLLLLALVPLALLLLATLVARWTLLRALRESL